MYGTVPVIVPVCCIFILIYLIIIESLRITYISVVYLKLQSMSYMSYVEYEYIECVQQIKITNADTVGCSCGMSVREFTILV